MTLADARRPAYERLMAARGLDAILLTTAESVQHATGVRMYTQELIPERPVVAVLAAGRTSVVCWEWEHHQVGAQAPGSELVGFAEFGRDAWQVVAETVEAMGGLGCRVLVEMTCPWAAVEAMTARTAVVSRDEGFDGILSARMAKDDAEVALLTAAAQAADEAIGDAAASRVRGASERVVAQRIFDRFATAAPGLAQGTGICAGAANNLSNHHLASDLPLVEGPVRLGLQARVDGYWMILTRMGTFATDDQATGFADDYARYIDAWWAGFERLRPGVTAGEVYAAVRDRLAASGITIRSQKVGHGTGLTFREPPVLRADDPTPLAPGMVLAFDFAVRPETTRAGRFVHVEDRVKVTDTGPHRLSDRTDLSTPYRLGAAATDLGRAEEGDPA